MATAFRIHEDIENLLEAKKDRKNVATGKNASAANDKNQMQQQRSTFAILNNVDYDGGRNVAATHAQKSAFNVLQSKRVGTKSNDENVMPNRCISKPDAKFPVDKFKAFNVFEQENEQQQQQQYTDENKPPLSSELETTNDEVDQASVSNISFSSMRLPLQELKQDVETPLYVREILSPMSVDKSAVGNESLLVVDDLQASAGSTSTRRFKEDLDKFFEIEEYRDDILNYLREAEQRHRPKAMYMRKQPDISHSMRTILVDWLVEVGEEYRLQNETLCLAVSYIDRFLSVMSVVRAKLQLVGTAAMFIAAKYEEIYPPDVGEFVYITDSTYTKKQVLRMEQLILKVLTFDLCVPTTSVFLNAYPIMDGLPKEVKFLAQYLCELSLLEAEPYLQYTPSMISAAAIALARLNFDLPIWSKELERFTGHQVHNLAEIILHLNNTHCASVNLPQQAIQDKYKHSKYLEVSTKTPVRIDDVSLSNILQKLEYDEPDNDIDTHESNENVRKMISSLLFV